MALDDVQQLLDYLKDTPEIMELSVTGSGGTVTLKRHAAIPPPSLLPSVSPVLPESAVLFAPPAFEEAHFITATMVGLFHEAAPPLAAGGILAAGQAVGAIESMRLMNELTADQGGIIAEVLIAEGQPVEYGQPLFRIQTAESFAAALDAARE